MTTKDKTGDQLVASIRKSKTGAVSQKNTKRRTTSKKKASKRARAVTAKTRVTASRGVADSYTAGGRVWPD